MFKKYKKCPYCKNKSFLYISGKDYNRGISDIIYNLHKCSSCGLTFISNPPKDIAKYYPNNYHSVPTDEEMNKYVLDQKFKLDMLLPFKNKGSLLDIGSSIGIFPEMAKRQGFDVNVIEMDKDCVDFLNNKLKIKAIQSNNPAEVLKRESKKYDVISLWHSIEHMPNPFEVLEECIKNLNKDGVLLIAAPNCKGLQANIMKKLWMHFDIPRHLYGFSISWFENFSKKNQLEPIFITTEDEESIRCKNTALKSFVLNYNPSNFFQKIKSKFICKICNINKKRYGATFTIIMRKKY